MSRAVESAAAPRSSVRSAATALWTRSLRPFWPVWVAVLIGCWLRIRLWWEDRAFWRDELSLVQSLDFYSLGDLLFGPLADAQSAPPGWLLLERLVATVLGTGERAYRVLPLVLGCGTLVLAALLTLRFVRRGWTAAVPVLVLATLPQLVYYTAQAKQYTTDTFLVTALLLFAVHLLRSEPRPRTERWWYALVAIAPWFSHGFMLSAPLVVGLVALIQWRRGQRSLRHLAVRLAIPALSVLLAALWARHLTSMVRDFQSYWAPFLWDSANGLRSLLTWSGSTIADLGIKSLRFGAWWPLLLLLPGAVAAFARRWTRGTAILLVLPLVAAYAAGVAGAYPFGRRLILFCLPALLVFLGILVDAIAGRVATWSRRTWAGSLAGVVAAGLVSAATWTTPGELAHDLRFLYGADDYRIALRFVAEKWEDGDVLVMGNGDRAAFRVYGTRLRLPTDRAYRAMPVVDRTARTGCPLPAELTRARRIWLVSGDLVPLYPGVTSRFALAAPLMDRYRVIYFTDRGLTSIQLLLAGPGSKPPTPARCLSYAPIGPPGAPKFPPTLPVDAGRP